MDTVITTTVIITSLVAVMASPVFVVAWRRQRRDTIRNFALGAVVIGVLCGSITAISERQVDQCLAAGNTDCIDAGAAGLQLVIIGIFVLSSWVAASVMWRD
ncbi:MAG TPA: hypothetical protein VFP42_12350 [Acidimicrobiia bacterium]|nr:hypothetical protein [Acidimicrobiia bacterium]